jgi:hypothetical protein
MGFLKRITSFFSAPAPVDDKREYWIHVRCNRCGERVRARVDLWNELSWTDPESGSNSAYTCRKVLMGSGTCFQQIEVNLYFDSNRKLIERKTTGGKFID